MIANTKSFKITDKLEVGGRGELFFILGPCVIESEDHALSMAKKIKEIADKLNINWVFKSSYDKANRSSINSYRGPGMKEGLKILKRVKEEIGIPVISDVHEIEQVEPAAEILDIIQIPAFLSRQTDLLLTAGKTDKTINVKKGQFLSPWDTKNIIKKLESAGCEKILMTERGASFGYNHLVVDMKSFPVMRELGYPVVFDATHSVQLPGGMGTASGGMRQYIEPLARAAVAAGVDGVFMEVHHCPEEAKCDGPNSLHLNSLERILIELIEIDKVVKKA